MNELFRLEINRFEEISHSLYSILKGYSTLSIASGQTGKTVVASVDLGPDELRALAKSLNHAADQIEEFRPKDMTF